MYFLHDSTPDGMTDKKLYNIFLPFDDYFLFFMIITNDKPFIYGENVFTFSLTLDILFY